MFKEHHGDFYPICNYWVPTEFIVNKNCEENHCRCLFLNTQFHIFVLSVVSEVKVNRPHFSGEILEL